MSLKQRALNGVKWTSLSSIIVTSVQITQLAILAHYLQPHDFGLMAIVTVIIGFSALFMDMGVSASIIHKQNITHIQLSSLYWLNVGSGILLYGIIYCLAPLLASFYNEVELIPIVRLIAITFIVSGLGNQYGILLQKTLKFNVIAKISIISTFAGFTVAVILAINGFGVYSLVYASLTTAITMSFINILTGVKKHKPSLHYCHSEITPMLSFGIFQMGEKGINYFNSQFDVILIGKLLGTEALGIYTIAKNLSMRPAQIINPVITNVTFPIMAKMQDNMSRLKEIYIKSVNYLSSVNFPIYILLAILAEPLIVILFGERWEKSIVLLQILSVYAALRSIGNPTGSLLLSKGRADLGFYWNLGLFIFVPLTIYCGSFWGLQGIAFSLLGLMAILTIPSWHYLIKPLCGATFTEYFWQIIKPLILALIAGAFSYNAVLIFHVNNMLFSSILTTIIMLIFVLLLNTLFNKEFVSIAYLLLGRKDKTS